MEMTYKQTIELTPAQVKEILKNHIADAFKLSGNIQVELKVGTRLVGHQMNESSETYFEGAFLQVITVQGER